jgi:hypothetical protein
MFTFSNYPLFYLLSLLPQLLYQYQTIFEVSLNPQFPLFLFVVSIPIPLKQNHVFLFKTVAKEIITQLSAKKNNLLYVIFSQKQAIPSIIMGNIGLELGGSSSFVENEWQQIYPIHLFSEFNFNNNSIPWP